MTIIVALETPGGVVLAADSLKYEEDFDIITERHDSKVLFRANMTVACAGTPIALQLLEFAEYPERSTGFTARQYLIAQFVPFLRTLFTDNGLNEVRDNKINHPDFIFVVIDNEIYTINNYQVDRSTERYDAIGTGRPFAIGSLFSTGDKIPTKRVQLAAQAACKFSPHCGGAFPVYTIATHEGIQHWSLP